ncbi:tRNA dihydrouridine(20/20a) synthase DusA [Aliidiomarina sedimenti]|uniref:tRNA-dihydrouridine(20/20a) synthase n=1 Tax=Aliidiomarina sedimenti TaxID=1933879 RepID=A0ABY0BZM7_9GAMM|nr:tRNA dihydrouridine(20/20a) synthase DusA [Aliidiomarina sedimenti]RUO30078.1 tRNA dihydrouridine(20/20a) synthase DusA [Aliidiomarina sedimenti]
MSQIFAVAPMIDWTDRHCRYFHRQLSTRAVLYTEMVTTGAIIHGKNDFLLYNEDEHPLVLQLGGSNPADLAACTRLAVERGYDEINLNVGCPSDRVQNGRFGACLMAEPELVGDCLKAMQDAAGTVPVSIKTRLGIDEQDSYSFLMRLLQAVDNAGVSRLTLHARKAWLNGLSPKENRDIPPLDYDRVHQVKRDLAHFEVLLNGGLQSLDEAQAQLQFVDGVMLGRAVYQNPWMLAAVDSVLYGQPIKWQAPEEVLPVMADYIERHIAAGGRFWHVARHMLGLFQNRPGARQWRRHLSENGPRAESAAPLYEAAEKVLGQAVA